MGPKETLLLGSLALSGCVPTIKSNETGIPHDSGLDTAETGDTGGTEPTRVPYCPDGEEYEVLDLVKATRVLSGAECPDPGSCQESGDLTSETVDAAYQEVSGREDMESTPFTVELTCVDTPVTTTEAYYEPDEKNHYPDSWKQQCFGTVYYGQPVDPQYTPLWAVAAGANSYDNGNTYMPSHFSEIYDLTLEENGSENSLGINNYNAEHTSWDNPELVDTVNVHGYRYDLNETDMTGTLEALEEHVQNFVCAGLSLMTEEDEFPGQEGLYTGTFQIVAPM